MLKSCPVKIQRTASTNNGALKPQQQPLSAYFRPGPVENRAGAAPSTGENPSASPTKARGPPVPIQPAVREDAQGSPEKVPASRSSSLIPIGGATGHELGIAVVPGAQTDFGLAIDAPPRADRDPESRSGSPPNVLPLDLLDGELLGHGSPRGGVFWDKSPTSVKIRHEMSSKIRATAGVFVRTL